MSIFDRMNATPIMIAMGKMVTDPNYSKMIDLERKKTELSSLIGVDATKFIETRYPTLISLDQIDSLIYLAKMRQFDELIELIEHGEVMTERYENGR